MVVGLGGGAGGGERERGGGLRCQMIVRVSL